MISVRADALGHVRSLMRFLTSLRVSFLQAALLVGSQEAADSIVDYDSGDDFLVFAKWATVGGPFLTLGSDGGESELYGPSANKRKPCFGGAIIWGLRSKQEECGGTQLSSSVKCRP